jgi:mannitol/fructose-specific phosphotransferase system IIA component (Ntr-type)
MSIKNLLPIERIAIDIKAEDWQAAVRAVGQLMVDTNVVEERYVEGMINTTKELGPYIVIAPGVAIPHARPEDGVVAPCLAFARLDPPVNFGNEHNDPVHILFALGAIDHDGHVDALKQVAELLLDGQKYTDLLTAVTVDEVAAIIYA